MSAETVLSVTPAKQAEILNTLAYHRAVIAKREGLAKTATGTAKQDHELVLARRRKDLEKLVVEAKALGIEIPGEVATAAPKKL